MENITIEEKGYAKVNLALHVTGFKKSGYHILDSIVIFTDIFDSLFFKKNKNNPRQNHVTALEKLKQTLAHG